MPHARAPLDRIQCSARARLTRSRRFTGDLEHWRYDTFRVHWRASPFFTEGFATFALDAKGQVTQVTVDPFGVFGRARTGQAAQ